MTPILSDLFPPDHRLLPVNQYVLRRCGLCAALVHDDANSMVRHHAWHEDLDQHHLAPPDPEPVPEPEPDISPDAAEAPRTRRAPGRGRPSADVA